VTQQLPDNILKALETEDAAAFPGEPYLCWIFLKNYSDYLGVDTAEVLIVVSREKNIQESPVSRRTSGKAKAKLSASALSSLVPLSEGVGFLRSSFISLPFKYAGNKK